MSEHDGEFKIIHSLLKEARQAGEAHGRAAERASFAEECVRELTEEAARYEKQWPITGMQSAETRFKKAISIITRLAQERGEK